MHIVIAAIRRHDEKMLRRARRCKKRLFRVWNIWHPLHAIVDKPIKLFHALSFHFLFHLPVPRYCVSRGISKPFHRELATKNREDLPTLNNFGGYNLLTDKEIYVHGRAIYALI